MGTANFGIVGLDWQRVNWDRLKKYRTERARAYEEARSRRDALHVRRERSISHRHAYARLESAQAGAALCSVMRRWRAGAVRAGRSGFSDRAPFAVDSQRERPVLLCLDQTRRRPGLGTHLARLSRCKRAHIRLLSAPRSERATDTRAIQDYLGHRRSPRPCATPPSRRTASRGSGGTEGPTRGQNKKGACRTKLHREHRRRGAWDGAVAVQQVLFPGHSLGSVTLGSGSLSCCFRVTPSRARDGTVG